MPDSASRTPHQQTSTSDPDATRDPGRPLNASRPTYPSQQDIHTPAEQLPPTETIPFYRSSDHRDPDSSRHSLIRRLFLRYDEPAGDESLPIAREPSIPRNEVRQYGTMAEPSSTTRLHGSAEDRKPVRDGSKARQGLGPRPVGGTKKLGTFSGVFVPTSLNILSILMFLRFGFILGQAGVLGMLGMLVAAYFIDLVTVFSLSAIASNGTVRGGGAYYLISRSLGPEFGGSIGVVFYLGLVLVTGLNAVGLIDCLKQNIGELSGNWYNFLPEGRWHEYFYGTVVLVICTAICLAGSAIFARASNGLLIILLIATFSIPFSALIMSPWEDRDLGIFYTGLSLETFKGNLFPRLTEGAAGSQMDTKETFQDLFGILFSATSGIFAGASMSGDLKHPSKAIPKGTLYGLALTFSAYALVILAMAATITRASFLRNVNVIQDTNVSGILVLAGEFASSFFSTLMGVIGSAKLLQALARDKLLPGLAIFGQGTRIGDEPIYAIFFSFLLAQISMLADINQIASLVTMSYLVSDFRCNSLGTMRVLT